MKTLQDYQVQKVKFDYVINDLSEYLIDTDTGKYIDNEASIGPLRPLTGQTIHYHYTGTHENHFVFCNSLAKYGFSIIIQSLCIENRYSRDSTDAKLHYGSSSINEIVVSLNTVNCPFPLCSVFFLCSIFLPFLHLAM